MMQQGQQKAQSAGQQRASVTEVSADNLKKLALQQRRTSNDKNKKETTVFVGGLRKTTDEEKVLAHFSKYGSVENVDLKRLPDGTSRGFAFVKFASKETVEKVVEERAKHMIDNKWVAVVARDSSEYGRHNENGADKPAGGGSNSRPQPKQITEEEREQPERNADYEEKWSENYLKLAQQAAQREHDDDDSAAPMQENTGTTHEITPKMLNMMMRMGMMPIEPVPLRQINMMAQMGQLGQMGGMCPPGMMGQMGQMTQMRMMQQQQLQQQQLQQQQMKNMDKGNEQESNGSYEEKFTDNYLKLAQQLQKTEQEQSEDEAFSSTQDDTGKQSGVSAQMMNIMRMQQMCRMQQMRMQQMQMGMGMGQPWMRK